MTELSKDEQIEQLKASLDEAHVSIKMLTREHGRQKNMIQYLLGEALMVMGDGNETGLTEEFAEILRDEILHDLWYRLNDEQKLALRTNVPARIGIALHDVREFSSTINKLNDLVRLAVGYSIELFFEGISTWKKAEATK